LPIKKRKKKKKKKRERLEEEDKKEFKKKKNSLFCASKISNCHIPSNSNQKNSIFLVFKSEIP
jgi:hypothetical protein